MGGMRGQPSADYFAQRRAQFMEQMDSDSIAIIAAKKSLNGAGVADHKFKQDLAFYYLTGFEMPDAVCLIIPGGIDEFVMFVPPHRQPMRMPPSGMPGPMMGMGMMMGMPGMQMMMGRGGMGMIMGGQGMMGPTPLNPEIFYSTEQMEKILPFYLRGKTKVYGNSDDSVLRDKIINAAQGASLEFADPDPIITDLRVIKDELELTLLRRAIDITCEAQINVLKRAQPGMYEYEIEAIIEGTFFRNGSPRVGFTSICGSGPNTYELHYSRNTRQTEPGDMIVMDIGAEYGNYTADVTRTIPLDGKFSPEQRDIYEIVLKANQETIAIVRPGLDYGEINTTAQRVLAGGLHRLGFVEDPDLSWQVRLWTRHGVSHGIGLAVHEAATRSDRYSSGRRRGDNQLEVNSIFTVEPGIYISERGLERKPRDVSDDEWNTYIEKVTPLVEKYRYIGVRIEDDVLVTPEGHEIVSLKAPKTIEDIERIMNRKK